MQLPTPREPLRVRDEDGKFVELVYNEPAPGKEPLERASVVVERSAHGLAGIRLAAEEILDRSCGEVDYEGLRALGPELPHVLARMASSESRCGCHRGRRAAAVAALGRLRDPIAVDTLRALAGDRRTELAIRVRAAHGLARLGSPGSIAVLGELLRHDPAPAVRQAAALALGHAGSLDAVAALESAAKADAHLTVRVQAFASLRALERLAGARLTDVKEPRPQRRLGRGPVRDRATPSPSARRRSR